MGEKKFIIPFHEFGGKGQVLHFAHANAYPPKSYQLLLNHFTNQYRVLAMDQRPLWKNSSAKKFKNWNQLADDMILFFEENKISNVIGMGHSMGGVVSIMAAIKCPNLFSRLVLIDPVIFPKKYNLFTNLLPLNLRRKFIPMARLATKRRDSWNSQQEVYDSFRSKKVFRQFSDIALLDFVKAGTKIEDSGKITLTYPKDWETQVYITAPSLLKKLKKLKIPIIAIKGQYSNVITPTIWAEWKEAQPQNDFLEYPNSGHLVPMEYPRELATWILERLK